MPCVRWLANTGTLREYGKIFGMGATSLGYIFRRVCLALITKFQSTLLQFPRTEMDWKTSIGEFSGLFGMPNVVAAIDGSHIRINSPAKTIQRPFYNRKSFHSMILQGTVNAKGEFLDVNVGWPGSTGDPRIYRASKLYRRVHATPPLLPKGCFMLGDKIYRNETTLLTPHKTQSGVDPDAHVKRFNKVHSQTRVVVEAAFGALKGRWRRLSCAIAVDFGLIPDIVLAACLLHNICVKRHDPLDADTIKAYVDRERNWQKEKFRRNVNDDFRRSGAATPPPPISTTDEFPDIGESINAQASKVEINVHNREECQR